jgi:hypothetical protein
MMKPRALPGFFFATMAAFAASSPAAAQSLISTNGNWVAWSESAVPGVPFPDDYFAYGFFWPTIAEDGSCFFHGDIEGLNTTTANGRGLFKGTTNADLAMLLRQADSAPGLPDLYLVNAAGTKGISALRGSPDGRTMWTSYLTGPGVNSSNDTALFGGPADNPVVIAREGSPAPGTAGAVYEDLIGIVGGQSSFIEPQHTQINRNGIVSFVSKLRGGDTTGQNFGAIFYGPAASPGMFLRLSDTMMPGVIAAGIGGVVQMDNDGRVLFDVTLQGVGTTVSNDWSLWYYVPGVGRTMLFREGDPAPGTAGATFNNAFNNWTAVISGNGFTRNGKFVFTADLMNGDTVTGVNDRALYYATTSTPPVLISRMGDPAPGTNGMFWGYSVFYSGVNAAGRIFTQAQIIGGTVDDTNNTGFWTAPSPGAPFVNIVREGDLAPGCNGAVFDDLLGWLSSYNDAGQLVFQAPLRGGDVISGVNDSGLFAWDPVKGLFLIGRNGESLSPSPDSTFTSRFYAWLQFNNTDGAALGFGNDGKLAMRVGFNPQGEGVATVDLNCYPTTGYYPDADGDGYGSNDASLAVHVCSGGTPPAGYVTNNTDCNDANPNIHPGVPDANCNGIDENCDGTADEGYMSQPTTCGVGACQRNGATSCVNGSVQNSCVAGTPTAETCNGIDDDCNGVIDNVAAPTGSLAVTFAKPPGDTLLSWTASAAATGYDVVTGDLQELRGNGGNYATLTQASCASNDQSSTSYSAAASNPPPGGARWFLVRPMNCGGSGSYDEGVPSQQGLRDPEIQTGGWACP